MKRFLSALVFLSFLIPGLALAQQGQAVPPTLALANASSTGTTLNKLAKLTGAPSTFVITATTDTSGAIGVVTTGAGTTGRATVQTMGRASCVFDGSTTAGDYVGISGSVAGDCSDIGASYPGAGQVVGQVFSTNGSGGTYGVMLYPPGIKALTPGSGTVTSVSGTANQVSVASGTTTPVISLIGPYTPATYTAHGPLIGEGTSGIAAATAGGAGTVLGGNASADPSMQQKTDPHLCGSIAAQTSGQRLCFIPMAKSEILPSGCTGSQFAAFTAATGSTTLTINREHWTGSAWSITASDTVAWSAAGFLGTPTCSGSITFAVGDALEVLAPGTPDATLAAIGIVLLMSAQSL